MTGFPVACVHSIRLCPLNHTSREEDVTRVISFFEESDPTGLRRRPSPLYDRAAADTLGPRLQRVITTLQGSR